MAVPAPAPVTTPDELMEATAALLLLHTPPEVASVKEILAPTQTPEAPEMLAGAAGGAATVISFDAEALPQLFVTV